MHAVIPARSGSQRIKNKNVRLLGIYPLIAYSIEACLQSKLIDRVIVSTDCRKIADIAETFGAEVPFLRPKDLAANDSSDDGFLLHFFDNVVCDEVALIRPTSPHRNPGFMNECIREYLDQCSDRYTGFRTMSESSHSPYKMFTMNTDHVCQGFFDEYNGSKTYTNLPAQMLPVSYMPNGYIDIVKKATVSPGNTFGSTIYGKLSPKIIDIDVEYDWTVASHLLNSEHDVLTHGLDRQTHIGN